MRFFSNQRNKVFVSAAKDALVTGTLLLAASKCPVSNSPFMTNGEMLLDELTQSCQYIQIFFKIGSVSTLVVVNLNGFTNTAFVEVQSRFMQALSFTVNGKPLRSNTRWSDYGVTNGSTVFCHPRLHGGMSGKPAKISYEDLDVTIPKFEGVDPLNGEWVDYVSKRSLSCDLFKASQRLAKRTRKTHKTYEAQTLESVAPFVGVKDFLDKSVDVDILSLVEDLTLLIVQLIRAPHIVDSTLAVLTFLKLRTGGSLICNSANMIELIVSDIAGPTIQSDTDEYDLLSTVTEFRDILHNWDALKDSSLVKRSIKLFRYAAAVGVCAQVGITLDEATLKACKAESGGSFAGPNFLCALLDTIALLIQRALMFAKTGKWETFFHGPKSYGAWFDKCMEIKRHHVFIGNLEAHGTSYHQFVKDLSDSIETGRAILKFGEKSTGYELLAVKKLLNEMLMIQASVMTYTAAQQSRRPPFAMLVHGGSSVCKSTFVDMLFNYTGHILDLPTSGDFKYTRSPSDPFWSGWNSAKWFITLDDVAYLDPNSNIQDMSLTEIIQLVNDVPMVPNQAALEDKGKNPVRARVVVATTNTKHLNAHAHFACPLAVQRRLPFVVTIGAKRQYARDDAPTMLDPVKLPLIVEDFPDFWDIRVDKVVPCGDEGRARFENLHRFTNIHKFLDWLKDTMEVFQQVQVKASLGCAAMSGFKICRSCNRVKCECAHLQASESVEFKYYLPQGAIFGMPFVKEEFEDGCTWKREYTPCKRDDANYILKTSVFEGGELQRQWFTTLNVSESADTRAVEQADEIAMADILSEVVRRQAEATGTFVSRTIGSGVCKYLDWYMRSATVRHITHSAMEWKVCRSAATWMIGSYGADYAPFYQFCGNTVRNVYVTPKWRRALKGLAVITAIAATYKFVSTVSKVLAGKPSEKKKVVEEVEEVQGLRMSVEDSHFAKNQKENVWKRDDYETSSFDLTPTNVSYSSLPRDQLMQIVHNNVARIKVSNGEKAREGNALCVGGHLWVTNNHTFFPEGDLTISLMIEGTKMGASPNVEMKIRQHEILRDTSSDQAWFMVACWSPRRDLRSLIAKPSLDGQYRCAYTGYNKLRAKQENVVAAVKSGFASVEGLAPNIKAWHGMSFDLTVLGDCGMPLVVHKPQAAILGLHMLGNANQEIWATALDCDKVAMAVAHFDRPIIQSGVPEITAPSKFKSLGPLRQWSPLRWLEDGSIRVFGSYTDYRVTPRSKVIPTLLSEPILAERGWDVDAVRPELKDWRPWRHALVDVTNQPHGAMDSTKLRICAQAFVDDIIEGLTPDDFSSMQVLSDSAVINGIDGVKFIDKMNFKSSMGEPYCKTKKDFLVGDIGKKDFIPEIRERIARIEACYAEGKRACPVFSGQLKDEPRSRAKVAAGKIRVFTGAPADWSFVVRKYLLTIVKVIQENPLLFEASPGCAAQSAEWEQYYDHLTTFGFDRNVAGDYGKFDKMMEASLILEAFWILAQLLKVAGWTDEELTPIFCIAEDTAFSYVNFDGDLVEFFGSNPSGQPLTVIINCLVNALYMRYCFLELCPLEGTMYEKVRRFKEFVKLLTYGDDNAMCVSRDADWFNHTAIQRVLASVGVEYTMADKKSESRPFIHIREVSYLKRSWRWDEDIGAVVCPLEEASIHKMLTICNPSGTESPEVHMASVMCSAANEWFWYGKAKFEVEREWLWALAGKHNLQHELVLKSFPTWTECCMRYERASLGMSTKRLQGCVIEHPRTIVPN